MRTGKVKYIVMLMLLSAAMVTNAQQYLLISNGEKLKVNIVSVDSASVLFRLAKYTDTTLYVIAKENLQGIFFDRLSFDNTTELEFSEDPPYKSLNAIRKPEYINLKNANPVKVQMDTITDSQVMFRMANSADTTLYSLANKDIQHITFREISKGRNVVSAEQGFQLEQRAAADAMENYKAHYGAAAASYVSGMIFFYLLPILVPVSLSAMEPNENFLNYPDPKLAQKPEYVNSYKKTARKMKNSAIWTGFGLGVATDVVLIIFLVASLSH